MLNHFTLSCDLYINQQKFSSVSFSTRQFKTSVCLCIFLSLSLSTFLLSPPPLSFSFPIPNGFSPSRAEIQFRSSEGGRIVTQLVGGGQGRTTPHPGVAPWQEICPPLSAASSKQSTFNLQLNIFFQQSTSKFKTQSMFRKLYNFKQFARNHYNKCIQMIYTRSP